MKYSSVLLPTAFFPPIEYFVYIINAGEVYIEINEHYVKQTYRNRFYIYGPNGIQRIIIPVIRPEGNKTFIKDVLLSPSISNAEEKWTHILWRSIETAYNSSPFFLYYKDEIFDLLQGNYNTLIEFNNGILKSLLNITGIDRKIEFTKVYERNPINKVDLRDRFTRKSQRASEDYLHYPEYMQVFNNKYGFIPNLSIIDLLFNMGPSTIDYLRSIRDSIF